MVESMSLSRCIEFAVDAHRYQLDKLGKPYILHPLAVMLQCEPGDQKVAVMHDIWEDVYAPKFIRVMVNLTEPEYVALEAITHLPNEPYVDYIKRVKTSDIATRVKIQDVIHNQSRMDGLPDDVVERMTKKYITAMKMLMPDAE